MPHSFAHINKTGSVKIHPAARDSPAEPMVCTILFSKIESLRISTRITAIEITAAGMEAEMVIPTRKPKYALAPPNSTASSTPTITAVTVSSKGFLSAAI